MPEELAIARAVSQARAELGSGKPRAEVERKLASAEDAFSKLEERMRGYQRAHDAAEQARLSALVAEKAPELKKYLAAIASGKWGFPEAAGAVGIYNAAKDFQGLRRFSRDLLARRDVASLGERQDFVAYMEIVADLGLKDGPAMLAHGEIFLKKYPRSDFFEAVKAQMDGAIASARTTGTPAPGDFSPCPAP